MPIIRLAQRYNSFSPLLIGGDVVTEEAITTAVSMTTFSPLLIGGDVVTTRRLGTGRHDNVAFSPLLIGGDVVTSICRVRLARR